MIEEFKKHIWIAKSEFRLLPEDVLELDFGKISKQLDNNGVKVANIFNSKIDKFELSKFISKHLQIVKNIDLDSEEESLDSLVELLNESLLIDMYILWESLFSLLIMSNKRSLLELISLRILNAIEKIEFSENSFTYINEIKLNLQLHFHMTLANSFSVIARKNFKNVFLDNALRENLSLINDLNNYSYKFRKSNLTNKNFINIVPNFLEPLHIKLTENEEIELFRLSNIIGYIDKGYMSKLKSTKPNDEYYLYPYNISLLDVQIIKLIKRIQDDDWKCKFIETDLLKDTWLPINGYNVSNAGVFLNKICISDTGNSEINCKTKNLIFGDCEYEDVSKINKRIINYFESIEYCNPCIGIGNVRIEKPLEYYDRVRTGILDKSKERFKNLSETLNTVIKYKSKKGIKTNLFVLPEGYVPFEWLNLLVSTSKKNDIAIIAGLEHIKCEIKDKYKYYNFIVSIFPVKLEKFTIVNVNFHLKVHYSPDELKEFSNDVVCGNTYEMHKWRGMNIVPYCCYELTSIQDRALFKDDQVNLIAAVVNNKDVEYFSNIVESISRDLSAFVVQANDTNFGDSRIYQPVRGYGKNVLRFSGGLNYTALISKIELGDFKRHLSRPLLKQADDDSKWKARVPK